MSLHEVTVYPAEVRAPSAATSILQWLGLNQAQTPDWSVADAVLYQYYANVVVYAAVRAIAQDLSALDFRAGVNPDEPENFSKTCRLAQLLGPEPGSPNEELSTTQFWHYTVSQLLLGGFFAWEYEMVKGSSSEIFALWPLVGSCVRPVPSRDPRYYFSGIEYTVRGQTISFSRDRALYYWRPAQDDLRQAESPLRAARLSVSVMVLQDRYDYAFLKNDARPAAVVVHEAFSIRAERDAWREQFMMSHQGPDNAGRVHFIESGENGVAPKDAFDVKTLGLSQADAEFIRRYDQKLRDVVMAFGVPMSRLGDSSERTFSNADKEYEIYRENVLIPLAHELASIVNRKVAPKLGKEVGWFDLSKFKMAETNAKLITLGLPELLKHRIIKYNEARLAIGLTAVDGGDRFMTDEELALYQQGAVALFSGAAPIDRTEKDPEELEVGDVIEPPEPEPQPPQLAPPAPDGSQPAEGNLPADVEQGGQAEVPKAQRGARHEVRVRSQREERQLQAYRKADKKVRAHEATFQQLIQGIFDKQLKITLDRLEGKRGRQFLSNFVLEQRSNPHGYNQYKHGPKHMEPLATPRYSYTYAFQPDGPGVLRETTLPTGVLVQIGDPTGGMSDRQADQITHGIDLASRTKLINPVAGQPQLPGFTQKDVVHRENVLIDESMPINVFGSTDETVPNFIYLNPVTFNTEFMEILNAGDTFAPGSHLVPTPTFTVAHEYGHGAYFADKPPPHVKRPPPRVAETLSEYAGTEFHEANAEAFAEFAVTGGRTTNPFAQAQAKEYGWTAWALEEKRSNPVGYNQYKHRDGNGATSKAARKRAAADADAAFKEKYGQNRPSGEGDCFESAVHTMMAIPAGEAKNYRLAQGVVRGQGPVEGVYFDHSWVERTDPIRADDPMRDVIKRAQLNVTVIDNSNGLHVEMPKPQYYGIGHIDPASVHLYTKDQMMVEMVKTGNYGPWH